MQQQPPASVGLTYDNLQANANSGGATSIASIPADTDGEVVWLADLDDNGFYYISLSESFDGHSSGDLNFTWYRAFAEMQVKESGVGKGTIHNPLVAGEILKVRRVGATGAIEYVVDDSVEYTSLATNTNELFVQLFIVFDTYTIKNVHMNIDGTDTSCVWENRQNVDSV